VETAADAIRRGVTPPVSVSIGVDPLRSSGMYRDVRANILEGSATSATSDYQPSATISAPQRSGLPATGVSAMLNSRPASTCLNSLVIPRVRPAGFLSDVEVGQHIGALNVDVEDAFAGWLSIDLCEMQPDRVRPLRHVRIIFQ
jgi:hypothetical protein